MFVPAQQLVLEAWAVVTAVLLGLGLLERRLFGPPLESSRELWRTYWMGWALLLAGLQVSHFFFAVADGTRIAVGLIAATGWLVSLPALARLLRRAQAVLVLPLLLSIGFAYWLSNLSLAGPRFGDTGMYLIPTIHWYESHPAVPGLANVFVPLGHNLSYFLYGALLDGGPLHAKIYHVINSVLVLALVGRGIFACFALLRGRDEHAAANLFHALALVPTAELVFNLFLTSPSPDTAVYIFGIVLAGELVEILASREPRRSDVVRFAFLCSVGLTIKLSIAGLSLVGAAVALLWWIWRCGRSFAQALGAAVLCLLAAIVPAGSWIARNIVSSGYPFYPAPFFPLDVDWISRHDATAWIQAPMAMAPLHTIFTQTAWWQTRLNSLGWMDDDVYRPLLLIGGGLALVVLLRPLGWWRGRASLPLMLLLAPVAAFYFSFVNTPMPRYQGANLWILGIDLVLLAIAGFAAAPGAFARVLRLLVVAASVYGFTLPLQRGVSPWLALKDFEGTSPPRVRSETLASGLVVRVPENGVCWYAELPCTSEPHPGLRLREPGNIEAGFAIDPDAKAAPQGDNPPR